MIPVRVPKEVLRQDVGVHIRRRRVGSLMAFLTQASKQSEGKPSYVVGSRSYGYSESCIAPQLSPKIRGIILSDPGRV